VTPKIIIVGAGLAGSLLSILFARRGFDVSVYEKRPDPRLNGNTGEHRSINLGLSHRGLTALGKVGLRETVLAQTVPMRGRVIHAENGEAFQPYGKNDHEILHSIRRDKLLATLINEACRYPNIRFCFDYQCVHLDKETATVQLRHNLTGAEQSVAADFVVGADGAFSAVQRALRQQTGFTYRQEILEWGYKEIQMERRADGSTPLPNIEALHLWGRANGLVVGHPNDDGTLTATLFLPNEGSPDSFAALQTPQTVQNFFVREYPELLTLIPDLVDQYFQHPTGQLVTNSIAPWNYRDKIVLVGDACHAVYPFYGQGMNAAFEDCLVLDECIERHPGDWEAAFKQFQNIRKVNTDTLAQLSRRNFIELRDKVRSPLFLWRKRLDIALNRLLPKLWLPLPTMVIHTTIPYATAVKRAKYQDYVLYGFVLSAGMLLFSGVFRLIAGSLKRKKHKNKK
jgi:kynurenine 3-monooxygenase